MASTFALAFLLFGASICHSFSTVLSYTTQDSIAFEYLVQRINDVEAIQRRQQVDSEAQTQTIELQAKIIEQQAKEIAFLKDHCLNNLPDESRDIKLDTGAKFTDTGARFTETGGDSDEASQSQSTDVDGEAVFSIGADEVTLTQQLQSIHRRHKRQEGGVAFTVYLDHDVNLGLQQTIKFNQIITNEGGGYGIHTGVFTCPTAGVYMFVFYVAEREDNDVAVSLKINSAQMVDGVADSFHTNQDVQGGNTVIKRMAMGDVAWVEIHLYSHIEGSLIWRYATFSGVLLYQ